MAFWKNDLQEPKRQFRWYMDFSGNGGAMTGIKYALKKVDKPKAKIAEITHKYLNHFFYYPGRLEWEAVNVTFASVTEVDGTTTFNEILRNAGYNVPTQSVDGGLKERVTISKQKFEKALGVIDIVQVDAEGNVIEKWSLNRPFFTSVQFGALDYGSEEIVEITATIRYDWASLNDDQMIAR